MPRSLPDFEKEMVASPRSLVIPDVLIFSDLPADLCAGYCDRNVPAFLQRGGGGLAWFFRHFFQLLLADAAEKQGELAGLIF